MSCSNGYGISGSGTGFRPGANRLGGADSAQEIPVT
jgi:hypothetical protein